MNIYTHLLAPLLLNLLLALPSPLASAEGLKETTVGTYYVSNKHEQYVSKTYGSEMPYTMFFTADGKAIHGTQMATLSS